MTEDVRAGPWFLLGQSYVVLRYQPCMIVERTATEEGDLDGFNDGSYQENGGQDAYFLPGKTMRVKSAVE